MALPFNGDTHLEKHFLALKEKFGITMVVETGTYHGFTTKWLGQNFDTVYTIESNPAYIDIAIKNIMQDGGMPNITSLQGDSSKDLLQVIQACPQNLLIFLDAHWAKNPVLKELEQIKESGIKPVLVIHDFQVPGHPELGFDEYPGEKIVYNWEWIESRVEDIYGPEGYEKFYNTEATGAMRGCLFITPKIPTMTDSWIQNIGKAPKIKKYSQCGEEGYIIDILDNIGWGNNFVVDIGASDGGSNSNSKLFIEGRGFGSLLIDGKNFGNPAIKEEWILAENVVDVLNKYECPKEFTFLSFDLDGNDYDILDALLVEFRPRLLVCEINGTIPLGVSKKIVYNSDHRYKGDDYYGFSFSAAFVLAKKHGYRVIFQNDALNVYLVRADLLSDPDQEIQVSFKHLQYHPHNPVGKWETVS